jgi:WD40 repeat protein
MANPVGLVLATAAEDAVKFWNRDGEGIGSLPVTGARSVLWTKTALIVTSSHGVFRWPIKEAPDMVRRRMVLGKMEIIDERSGWERADLSRDGRWLALTHPEQITLLDLTGKNARVEVKGQADASFASISPDGHWLATGTRRGGDVAIWSLPQLTLERTLPGTGGANVLFSPDDNGTMLVAGNSSEYIVWNTDSWTVATRIRTKMGNYFGAMAFSPRMTAFVLESEKNKICFLHPGDFDELAAPDFDNEAPLAFSPEGALLVDLDARSHMVLWNLIELRANMKAIGLDWSLKPYPPLPPIPLMESVEMQD